MIRGVIFDMDGTLFDTERLYTIAWKQVGEEMGYSITTELLNQCRGKTAAIIRGIFEDTFGKEFRLLKKQDSEKMRFFMEMLARDGVPKKKGAYGAPFLFWEEKKIPVSSCHFYKTIAWRKSSSNVRNSGIFCSIYLWRHAKSK